MHPVFMRRAFGRRGRQTFERRSLEVIPDSFVLIMIVLAIPVVGIIAALVASRIPSRRSDS